MEGGRETLGSTLRLCKESGTPGREAQEGVLRTWKEEERGWRLRSRGQEGRRRTGQGGVEGGTQRSWEPSETVSRRRRGPLDVDQLRRGGVSKKMIAMAF